MEKNSFITSEGPLDSWISKKKTVKKDDLFQEKDSSSNSSDRLERLRISIQEKQNELSSFPDLLSKFGLSADKAQKAQAREEYAQMVAEYETLKKALEKPIKEAVNTSKKDIEVKEMDLYPEKKSLFKRLKELFSFNIPGKGSGSSSI
jgi:hypothetical protein